MPGSHLTDLQRPWCRIRKRAGDDPRFLEISRQGSARMRLSPVGFSGGLCGVAVGRDRRKLPLAERGGVGVRGTGGVDGKV